jgi:transposase
MRGRAHLTHGEVIAALVANRLTAPRPLYDVQGWAEHYAADAWLGTPAGLLNDDRLGRALDALSGHLEEVTSALAMAAIAKYGVDAARLHWDFTSIAFCGEYANQAEDAPRITFGHSSDHQPHRKQLKVAHGVAAGGVSIYHRVVSGNRHEATETHQLLERLRALAAPRRLLLVADAALVTIDNLLACEQAKVHFVARLPRRFPYEARARALPPDAFQVLDYTSDRSRRQPARLRPHFRGAEDHWEVATEAGRLDFRVLYVRGSEEQQAARSNRAKLLERAEQNLDRIAHGLRMQRHLTREVAERRVARAVAQGKVGQFLRTQLSDDGRELQWHRDEVALSEAEQGDGLYALITNLRPHEASSSRVLQLFKEQAEIERTHSMLKGPLNVRPIFLHSNRRAAALVAICAIALMIYGLIELVVRRALAPARTIAGLLPEKRAARPTAPNIFGAFATLGFDRVRTRDGLGEVGQPLTPAQARVLGLLGISSTLPPGSHPAVPECGKPG